MNEHRLREWLERYKAGECAVEDVLERWLASTQTSSEQPAIHLSDAGRLDLDRARRRGFPEVIFGHRKTPEQVATLFSDLGARNDVVLCTRVNEAQVAATKAVFPACQHDPVARALFFERSPVADRGRGEVLVVAAGTTDLPTAQEALLTARLMGNRVEMLFDVGVAGLHRLLSVMERIKQAEIVIVVAGMEGALPSVLGGLCDRPIIAVPTSVGLGTGADGSAALHSMLNSCVAGLTVVNIDNGFGAGYAASLMNRKRVENLPSQG